MDINEKELIWVSKEFSKEYKEIESEDAQIEAFKNYMETVKKASQDSFKVDFESLEEDVAIYKGLMLNVKRAFESAKSEQLNASYELWEKFDLEIPVVRKKINTITEQLTPLTNELEKINGLMSKINSYNMDKLRESIHSIVNLYSTEKEMFEFLVKNFKRPE